MGLFQRLFGKQATSSAPGTEKEAEGLQAPGAPCAADPPEFVRAVDLQRAYWTHNPVEQAQLQGRGFGQLNWGERFRLHHLICLQRVGAGPEPAAVAEQCRALVHQLLAVDSPYRPRPAMVWQGQAAPPGGGREPSLQGEFLNASLTHLGCLEIYRVDAADQPTGIDFVAFDALSAVVFGPPSLIRAAKLFYEDGRAEVVLVPMLYGLTWAIGNEFDRAGRMTRFVAHLHDVEVRGLGAEGMGVGQQDFSIRTPDSGSLFGLGSVASFSFPLDMRDPRFDEKARARGIDPDEIRRRMG
jgi:hypothetical protein